MLLDLHIHGSYGNVSILIFVLDFSMAFFSNLMRLKLHHFHATFVASVSQMRSIILLRIETGTELFLCARLRGVFLGDMFHMHL